MGSGRRMHAVLGIAGSMVVAAGIATPVLASGSPPVAAAGGWHVKVFANGSGTLYGSDDITSLGGTVYVAWQNGVGSTGGPAPGGGTTSTVIAYASNGTPVAQWSLTGKVDGMTADNRTGTVIATVNEDGNSSLYTIKPAMPAAAQVTHYAYNLSPLPHGGGTDAPSVVNGAILLSASAPTAAGGAAVYKVTLTGPTAVLQPVFFDNSPAVVANTNAPNAGATVPLALTDPDSNTVVPSSSPRFAGDFVLDSQGDQQQVFVSGAAGVHPGLSVLSLSQSVDDSAWATSSTGTLYVTDSVDNEVFAVTGNFQPGMVLTAATPSNANNPVNAPNYLATIDLNTGAVAPLITTIQAKGLLFMP